MGSSFCACHRCIACCTLLPQLPAISNMYGTSTIGAGYGGYGAPTMGAGYGTTTMRAGYGTTTMGAGYGMPMTGGVSYAQGAIQTMGRVAMDSVVNERIVEIPQMAVARQTIQEIEKRVAVP